MTPTEVFIVTAGEYSDYRIFAVYLDRAAAEEHVRLMKIDNDWGAYSEPQVEVWGVGPRLPELAEVYRYFAAIDVDKQVPEPHVLSSEEITNLGPEHVSVSMHRRQTGRHSGHTFVHLRVEGRNPERVAKVYTERAAKVIANPSVIPDAVDWVGSEIVEVNEDA